MIIAAHDLFCVLKINKLLGNLSPSKEDREQLKDKTAF